MEGKNFNKIVHIPGKAANDNLEKELESFVPDLAKVMSIKRLVGLAQESGDGASHWSDVNVAETKEALAGFNLKDAIREINNATEELVTKRPAYYAALIDMLEEQTQEVGTDHE